MSLTREEWEKMWDSTVRIEDCIRELPPHIGCKKRTLRELRKIQDKIQLVIGQMR